MSNVFNDKLDKGRKKEIQIEKWGVRNFYEVGRSLKSNTSRKRVRLSRVWFLLILGARSEEAGKWEIIGRSERNKRQGCQAWGGEGLLCFLLNGNRKGKGCQNSPFCYIILPGMYTVKMFGIRMEVRPSQEPTVTTLKKKYDRLGKLPLSVWTGE